MKIITLTKDKDLEIKKFAHKEWKKWNLEHYGTKDAWFDQQDLFIKAEEKGEILGFVKLNVDEGVANIDSIIVKDKKIGTGIGKKLILAAEKLAKRKKCHKIQLQTGKNWHQRSFYDHMGYTKTHEMPNHFRHQDFVEYTKYLSVKAEYHGFNHGAS